jgi:hypothetical protein
MYIDFGRGYSSAAIQESIDSQLADIGSVDPADLHRFAIVLQERQGQLDAITAIEDDFGDLTDWAAEKGWGETLVVAEKLNVLVKLALRKVDDTWSGRGNDAKRAYADGWRDAVDAAFRSVQHELGQLAKVANEAVTA